MISNHLLFSDLQELLAENIFLWSAFSLLERSFGLFGPTEIYNSNVEIVVDLSIARLSNRRAPTRVHDHLPTPVRRKPFTRVPDYNPNSKIIYNPIRNIIHNPLSWSLTRVTDHNPCEKNNLQPASKIIYGPSVITVDSDQIS